MKTVKCFGKEVGKMKRLMIALLAVFFILNACATVPKKPITPGDLPDLKGKWEGTRELFVGTVHTLTYAEMEIYNDTLPLQGKITLHLYTGDIRTHAFENTQITDQGNLIIGLPRGEKLDFILYKGEGKKTLYGSYDNREGGGVGRITLHKK
jgi:hypothetical protein